MLFLEITVKQFSSHSDIIKLGDVQALLREDFENIGMLLGEETCKLGQKILY